MSKSLLDLIKSRQEKQAEYNYGIHTADVYVKTLSTCVGSDLCYRYGSTRSTSFDDAVKRAGATLTYGNPDMVLNEVYGKESLPSGIEIPKNALMVFKHVLTTPRKDRDGDILRTKGARPDPNMLLLWQHVHTLPIGKSLGVAEHTEKQLVMYSAVVDVNELAHDAAVMIENKMGRFSHGFKALEFTAIKSADDDEKAPTGRTTGDKGFDVRAFEIMEESLVSVPANVDAETLEVYLDLIEGDKLTSSIMKSYGKRLRSERSTRFSGVDFKGGEKHGKGKDKDCPCGCGGTCGCGSKPAPEKTNDDSNEDKSSTDDGTKDNKMREMCPHCDTALEAGTCPKCGYEKVGSEKVQDEAEKHKDAGGLFIKSGRVLSTTNYNALKEIHSDLEEIHEHCSTRSGKALTRKCQMSVKGVLQSQDGPNGDLANDVEELAKPKASFTEWVATATPDQRKRALDVLLAMGEVDEVQRLTTSFQKSIKRQVAINSSES